MSRFDEMMGRLLPSERKLLAIECAQQQVAAGALIGGWAAFNRYPEDAREITQLIQRYLLCGYLCLALSKPDHPLTRPCDRIGGA